MVFTSFTPSSQQPSAKKRSGVKKGEYERVAASFSRLTHAFSLIFRLRAVTVPVAN